MLLSEEQARQIEALTESTNKWLASLTEKELEEACAKGDKGKCYVSFEDFPATDTGVASILSNLIPRMCGASAELKFYFGIMGSVWFDTEVPGVDGSGDPRPVRVALVPPGHGKPVGVEHMFHVLCLNQMYS